MGHERGIKFYCIKLEIGVEGCLLQKQNLVHPDWEYGINVLSVSFHPVLTCVFHLLPLHLIYASLFHHSIFCVLLSLYVFFFPLVVGYTRWYPDLFPQYFAHSQTHDGNVLLCVLEFTCKLKLSSIILMVSTDFYPHITALNRTNVGMLSLTMLKALIWKNPKKSSRVLEAAVYDFSSSFIKSSLGVY